MVAYKPNALRSLLHFGEAAIQAQHSIPTRRPVALFDYFFYFEENCYFFLLALKKDLAPRGLTKEEEVLAAFSTKM